MEQIRPRIWVMVLVLALVWTAGAAVAAPAEQSDAGQEYTVQPGDCLTTIAARFLGGQRYWEAIWQANNLRAMSDPRFALIRDPNLIYGGQLLYVPGIAEAELLLDGGSSNRTALAPDPDHGVLSVDIAYLGQWYRDTFDYSKDAPNIRHFAVVVSEAGFLARPFSPGEICSSLNFTTEGAPLELREGVAAGDWDLSVLHAVPYEALLEPGRYYVGGCFIAAALSREDAGAGDDAILYAGITGGGASSEFQLVEVAAGESRNVTITLRDADGWACPWVYVFDGVSFVRRLEILRGHRSQVREATQRSPLGPAAVRGGTLRLQIREERQETTYLDALYLEVDGRAVWPNADSPQAELLHAVDGQYVIINEGDVLELSFDVSSVAQNDAIGEIVVVAAGYYDDVLETR